MRKRWSGAPSWLSKGRGWWVLAAIAALAAASIVAVVLWPDEATEQPRERRYRNVTACLLTDGSGVTGEPASWVWAGMQDASVQALVRVQYVAVPSEQTAENASLYLAGLVPGCEMVIAVGQAPVAAVVERASRFAHVRFAVVSDEPVGGSVVTLTGGGEALRVSVAKHVMAVLGSSPDA